MTPSELSAIAARADAATPGPWREGRPDMATVVDGIDSKWIYAGHQYLAVASGLIKGPWSEVMANAAFIAAARSDVPALVAEVRRLQAAVEALTPLARLGLNARQWAAENMQNVEEVLEIARQAVDRLAEINDSKQGSA